MGGSQKRAAAVLDPAERFEVIDFLNREAELLDENAFREWLDLLTESIDYRIPIRVTRERNAETEFSDESYHLNEDRGSIETRIRRFETEYAWSENPPSRTRRNISNIRVTPEDGSYEVRSNLLMYRGFGDTTDEDVISGERHDRLVREADQLKLDSRTVFLDHTILGTDNLAVFL